MVHLLKEANRTAHFKAKGLTGLGSDDVWLGALLHPASVYAAVANLENNDALTAPYGDLGAALCLACAGSEALTCIIGFQGCALGVPFTVKMYWELCKCIGDPDQNSHENLGLIRCCF